MLFIKVEGMKRLINITMLAFLLVTTVVACPGCGSENDSIVEISWVDFIMFNGIMYERKFVSLDSLAEEDLKYYDKTKYKLADNVNELGYQIKNGDAAYLDEGTPIYSIKEYSPEFRLVAKTGEELLLFEVDTNPNAKTGADLLDIGGNVEYIGINSSVDGITEIASITDEKLVSNLVEMVLNAPVDQDLLSSGGRKLFIVFYLSDGTFVKRSFHPDEGLLSRGILLPDEFWEIIRLFVPINI
jgi:hypothetical protein